MAVALVLQQQAPSMAHHTLETMVDQVAVVAETKLVQEHQLLAVKVFILEAHLSVQQDKVMMADQEQGLVILLQVAVVVLMVLVVMQLLQHLEQVVLD
jgi:hypothetical protein